jgi:hypothetical protein
VSKDTVTLINAKCKLGTPINPVAEITVSLYINEIQCQNLEMYTHAVQIYTARSVSRQVTNSVAQEPEGSSPRSQQPTTSPYPEPVKSNPHPPSQSP